MAIGRPVLSKNAWSRFPEAISHYEKFGFTFANLPWTTDYANYQITSPLNCESILSFEKDPELPLPFVASAEQVFLNGYFGRFQGITPCFRDDAQDKLHFPHFMKLELFDNRHPEDGLARMLDAAVQFFLRFIDVTVVAMPPVEIGQCKDQTAFDIVSSDGIELGSYGIRHHKHCIDNRWAYGTGLAEPRLGIVMGEHKCVTY